MERTIILYGNDWSIEFDFTITASHVERVGRIGMRNTILDDWEITIVSVNGAPPDCFSDKMLAMVVDALENESDLIQRESELHAYDHVTSEWDRRHDEMMEAI